MKPTVISKYLERYAEPEARAVDRVDGPWQHVVCIPACQERDSLLPTLRSIRAARGAEHALVVVVLNGAVGASDAVHEDNAQTADLLSAACGLTPGPLMWGALDGMGICVIDRWSEPLLLPQGQGVGLARKIACDVALALIRNRAVTGQWIRCTDADVTVPVGYFEVLPDRTTDAAAAVYPFMHMPEGSAVQREAMALYDAYLRYYVRGLAVAGSPYAFHCIGSLIAVRAQAYAAVRGFPKREAGEDFYLLNKLAKIGPVLSPPGDPVQIRGRLSDRVPFGTGASLQKISDLLGAGEPYLVYAPEIFSGLGIWMNALRDFSVSGDAEGLRTYVREPDSPLRAALYATLEQQGAFRAAEAAAAQVSGARLLRRLMEWNDAFRTLKLIHALRDALGGEIDARVLLTADGEMLFVEQQRANDV